MNFNFSKQWRLYKIEDESQQILGQLQYDLPTPLINIGDKEIWIEKTSKPNRRAFIDNANNTRLGEVETMGGYGVNLFWQDIPSTPIGTIIINDVLFKFRRIAPNVKHSFSAETNWQHFRFILYAVKGNVRYEYDLKMDTPAWRKNQHTQHCLFTGTIQSNEGNVLAMLAGFYLMEFEFYHEDNKNSG